MCANCDIDDAYVSSTSSAINAAALGAAWLDSYKPGWNTLVNVETLSMITSDRCILGQVFLDEAEKEFQEYIRVHGPEYAYLRSGYAYAADVLAELDMSEYDHGFNTLYGNWSKLESAWTEEIKDRM
jgi:hypothetical protein